MALRKNIPEIISAAVFAVVRFFVRIVTDPRSLIFSQDEQSPAVGESSLPQGVKKKHPIILGVLILVILVSIIFIGFTQFGLEYRTTVDTGPDTALGQVMAEETIQLLGGKGKIVVIAMDQHLKLPSHVAQVKAFLKTLSAKGGVTVESIETMTDPNLILEGPQRGLPSPIFFSVLEKHRHASAIVSFLGEPSLNDEEIASLDKDIPKMIAFSSIGMRLKKLFEENVVQVAILPNSGPRLPSSQKTETLREKFDRSYLVITSETASTFLP